ncbi:MAG: hypothetical protein ABJC60_02075 [Actinomycetota bacterium]
MVSIFLWIAAAILALNALAAIWFTVLSLSLRSRGRRRSAGAGDQWGLRAGGPIGVPRLPRAAILVSPIGHRISSRRVMGIALCAALLFAGTAFASPRARHIVVGALGMVARGFGPGPSERSATTAAPGTEGSSSTGAGPSTAEASPAPGSDAVRSSAGVRSGAPTAVPAAGDTGPATPTAVTALSDSSTSIDVTWTEVDGETGYRVERSFDGTTGWTTIATLGQDVTIYHDAGLSSGATAYYRVVATDASSDSEPSDVVSATTSVDPVSPTTVTAVSASLSEIDLDWADVAGETGYRVERSLDGTGAWTTVATTGQDVTTYHDAGLSSDTTVYYRVFATNGGGDSAPSDVVSATTTGVEDEPTP